MPHGKLNNGIYRALLPVMAPSPRGHMMHDLSGLPLTDLQGYVRLLLRHHVLGASLLLRDGDRQAAVFTSLTGDAPKASSEKTPGSTEEPTWRESWTRTPPPPPFCPTRRACCPA